MKGRLAFSLLVLATLVFACSRTRTNDARSTARNSRVHGAGVISTFAIRVNDDVQFQMDVINEGNRKVELNFANGMTHDIVVLDQGGREVWRWSDGRLFTAAYQNKVLRTNDTLSFHESWKNPTPGQYVAVARVASQNYPQERRVTFKVQ